MFSSCIIIPIIVGLICALLGYLLGRMFSSSGDDGRSEQLQADLDACRSNATKLKAKIADLEGQVAKLKASSASTSAGTQGFAAAGAGAAAATAAESSTGSSRTFDAGAASKILGKKVKENDLKVVEGIGPKTEELFHQAGITTWQTLSEASVEECRKVLATGGERFSIHNPNTWPRQAKLAYEGNWEELKNWQDQLDGGKE